MPTTEKVFAECLNCGRGFSGRKKLGETARYCTKACMIAYEAEHGRMGRERAERITFTCQQCGAPFNLLPGFVAAYRKKHGRDPMYCSRTCTGLARRTQTEADQTFECEHCGKTVDRRRYQRSTGHTKFYTEQKYCSPECKILGQAVRAEKRFLAGDIGRHVKKHGYVWLSIPANISRTGKKTEMLEHRWVMEKHLGRPLLKGETVHHINGERADNRIENLELFSSRHGPGQRVVDMVNFAGETLIRYWDQLTPEQIDQMRAVIEESERHHALAETG